MQKYADPIKTVLKNVENVIIDIEDIEDRLEDIIIYENEDTAIYVSPIFILLDNFGYEMRQGWVCTKYNETEWLPDHKVTLIYSFHSDLSEYLFINEDDFCRTLYQYLKSQHKIIDVDNIPCSIYL